MIQKELFVLAAGLLQVPVIQKSFCYISDKISIKGVSEMISLLTLYFASLFMSTEIKAVKLEFDGTSMSIELSQQPKIVMEYGYVVIKTGNESIALSLPCKATFVEAIGSALEDVVVRNNDEVKPLNVYTIDGKKVATLKYKHDLITLRRGIYIINGKKMIIN